MILFKPEELSTKSHEELKEIAAQLAEENYSAHAALYSFYGKYADGDEKADAAKKAEVAGKYKELWKLRRQGIPSWMAGDVEGDA